MNLPVKAELSAIESSTRSSEMIERKYQKGISEPGLWQCTREPEVHESLIMIEKLEQRDDHNNYRMTIQHSYSLVDKCGTVEVRMNR